VAYGIPHSLADIGTNDSAFVPRQAFDNYALRRQDVTLKKVHPLNFM